MEPTAKIQGQPLNILLVEDNPDHVELIQYCLQEHQVANRLYCVQDGAQAMDFLYQRGAYSDAEMYPPPILVLLDLRLPKIDGLEVLRLMRLDERLGQIPVVILTTSEAEIDVARAYEYHANSYLVKPVDFEKFSKMMKDLGYYWLSWNHFPWHPSEQTV